jgi:hypothetical protein
LLVTNAKSSASTFSIRSRSSMPCQPRSRTHVDSKWPHATAICRSRGVRHSSMGNLSVVAPAAWPSRAGRAGLVADAPGHELARRSAGRSSANTHPARGLPGFPFRGRTERSRWAAVSP